MSIKVGDRVTIVDTAAFSPLNGEIGEVLRIYEVNPPVAYVVLESGKAGIKIPLDFLEKVEPKVEIPEGAKQITKEDFGAALKEITSPEAVISEGSGDHFRDLLEGLAALAFGIKLNQSLFKDSDVVILTEDDFVRSLWDACNPAAPIENADNVSAFDGLPAALASVIRLRGLVKILFGESDD